MDLGAFKADPLGSVPGIVERCVELDLFLEPVDPDFVTNRQASKLCDLAAFVLQATDFQITLRNDDAGHPHEGTANAIQGRQWLRQFANIFTAVLQAISHKFVGFETLDNPPSSLLKEAIAKMDSCRFLKTIEHRWGWDVSLASEDAGNDEAEKTLEEFCALAEQQVKADPGLAVEYEWSDVEHKILMRAGMRIR